MTEKEIKNTKEIEVISSKKKLIAKRDFPLNCPPHLVRDIKKGDDLSDIPEIYINNLKTEGVI